MRRHMYAAAGVFALSGIAVGAQTTSPSQPGTTAGATQQITVTGCVQSWTGAGTAGTSGSTTPGTTGSSQPSMSDIRYRLTDVEKSGAMSRGGATSGTTGATGATGTTGTTGSTGMTGAARSGEGAMDHDEYLLRAEGTSVSLSQHLNHKVEVTGRVSASMSPGVTTGTSGMTGTTGSTGSTGSTGTTSTTRSPESGASSMRSAMGGNAPVLTVSSIKMVANTCK